jgi:hypothetical protein
MSANTVVPVREARKPIEDVLRRGGSATIEFGARRRVLVHDPRVDAPAKPLPGPLKMLQKHTVRYMVTEGVRRVSSHIYVWNQMDEAIDYFLKDVDSTCPVTLTRRL